jgi:hypothetical protein
MVGIILFHCVSGYVFCIFTITDDAYFTMFDWLVLIRNIR